MEKAYLYTHLGLGDQIIANGMVRTLAKKYDTLYVFVKPKNLINVRRMFMDLDHVKLIPFEDSQVFQFMQISPNNKYIIAGHEPFWKILRDPKNTKKIDEIFYELAGVPFENKWKEFHIPRNTEREKSISDMYGLMGNPIKYAFVHDDDKRKITRNLPKDMKIVRPSIKWSIFDYLYMIENAEEIHCINSSFFCMIDCLFGKYNMNGNLFLHEYVRKDIGEESTPILGANWKIIK